MKRKGGTPLSHTFHQIKYPGNPIKCSLRSYSDRLASSRFPPGSNKRRAFCLLNFPGHNDANSETMVVRLRVYHSEKAWLVGSMSCSCKIVRRMLESIRLSVTRLSRFSKRSKSHCNWCLRFSSSFELDGIGAFSSRNSLSTKQYSSTPSIIVLSCSSTQCL